jgi:integrase
MTTENHTTEKPLQLIYTLADGELKVLECALDAVGDSFGIAARLMSRMGLRVGEVQKLSWKHVTLGNTSEPEIQIAEENTKTGYARTLPLPTSLAERLTQTRQAAYGKWEDRMLDPSQTQTITPFMDEPIVATRDGTRPTVRWFQLVIGKTAQAALGRRIKPHTLRHTFATRLLQRANLRVVQNALGHRSLLSTQVYTHPTMTELREAIQRSEDTEP